MNLKVKIPKRYKNTLSKRFNPKYAKLINGIYYIKASCSLCGVHHTLNGCGNCPFMKFERNKIDCLTWIDRIYKQREKYWRAFYWDCVKFDAINKTKAIKSLNWFRNEAEKLIEWI